MATLLVGGMASFGAYLLADRAVEQARSGNFHRAADQRHEAIHERITSTIGVLHAVRGLFAASDTVDRRQFSDFLNAIDVGLSVQALEWIPRVPAAERRSFEQKAVREGFRDFQFVERGPDRRLTRAAKRTEHFPVYFVEPFKGNEAAFGFDLASNKARVQALNQARDSGKAVATSRITLIQETGDQYGFLVFDPIYRNGKPRDTLRQRRANLTGFALGVFRVGDLVTQPSKGRRTQVEALDVRVFDLSAPGKIQRIYPKTLASGAAQDSFVSTKPQHFESLFSNSRTMVVGTRKWLIRVTPAAASPFLARNWQPWMALFAGLLVTGLAALYMRLLLNRTVAIQALVKQRTAALAEMTEELSRSNQDLESFAYVASHDLKSPLRNIDNLAEWIEEDLAEALDGEPRENMKMLRARVARLDQLLDDLLKYSIAGREENDVGPVDTKQLVDDITALLERPEAITVSTVGELPRFETVGGPLERVLLNLIDNAIKHHDLEAGKIQISAIEQDDFYRFSVSDDGPGIDPEFHDKVFDMFRTLKSRDEVEGSGIGLSMVQKLVERYGGRIWLESEPGARGTTFHFDWPKNSHGEAA